MKKERIFTKDFWMAFSALFFCSMVMYMLMTTLTEYVAKFGGGAAMGGVVSGIYVVGGMFSRLLAGRTLNRVGWKRLAGWALALHFVACLGYFAAGSLPVLIAVRFIQGLGFGAGATALITMGTSILPESRYGEATGYFMLAPTLAIAAGPYGGGLVYDYFGSTGCFIAASVMSLLTLVFALAVDLHGKGAPCHEEKRGENGIRGILELRAIPVSICIFLLAFGYVAVMSFYRLYAQQVNLVSEFASFFLVYGAALLVCRPLAGRLQDRLGDDLICTVGILAQTVGLLAIALRPSMFTIALCAVGCALGYGTLNSCCNAMACRCADPERQPQAIATYWVFCDGGMGIGPAVLGLVENAAQFGGMYCIAAGISLAALPIYWLTWGRKSRKAAGGHI